LFSRVLTDIFPLEAMLELRGKTVNGTVEWGRTKG
jgi:hypothetical protein